MKVTLSPLDADGYVRAIDRALRLVLFALTSLAVGSSACMPSANRSSNELVGRIAWPNEGDVWVASLPGARLQKIAAVPQGSAVTSVAWSPDGSQLIYALVSRRDGTGGTGADLIVAAADGSGERLLVDRERASTVLDMPQWLPSGRVYYTRLEISPREQHPALMRVIPGGVPEVVVEGGYASSVSGDESSLVYLMNTPEGQTLRRTDLRLPGQPSCELVGAIQFQALGPPRVSPDGRRIALAAAGTPSNKPVRSGCGGEIAVASASVAAAAPAQGPDLFSLANPFATTAWAHGVPFDIWAMDVDGGNLARVVDLQADDPRVSWSPDGSRLAIFSPGGLFVANAAGGGLRKLVDQAGYGGLDWVN